LKFISSIFKFTSSETLNPEPGSKLQRGKQLGIKIISEEEFEQLVKEKVEK